MSVCTAWLGVTINEMKLGSLCVNKSITNRNKSGNNNTQPCRTTCSYNLAHFTQLPVDSYCTLTVTDAVNHIRLVKRLAVDTLFAGNRCLSQALKLLSGGTYGLSHAISTNVN